MFLLGWSASAQSIILHLRNGDRIAGTVLSENTSTIHLSTAWTDDVTIPVAQITGREIVPPATNAVANSATNLPIKVVSGQELFGVQKKAVVLVDTNSWWRRWKGEASVGANLERGAADSELFYAKATLTYAQPYKSDPKEFFRNILTYDTAYGKTGPPPGTTNSPSVVSDNRMGGSSKTDFDLSRKWYIYNLGAAFYDHVRLINRHYEDGPGIGYHWFTGSNFVVNLELGANYQVEDRADGTRTENFYTRVGQDLTWKINKQMNLTEKAEYFQQADYATQYRAQFESTLSYALLLNVSLNLSVIDLYDTRPTAGVPDNDLQLRTSVGVKF
jgi:hypothetical protein